MSSLTFDIISPTSARTQTQNILFHATSKDSYERLRAPIRRTHPVLYPRAFSYQSLRRVILYQRVRARDPSHADTRISLGAGIERGSSLFMWISLDQVGRGHLSLG